MLQALLGYLILPNWRLLLFISSVPIFILMILWFFVPESVLFLESKGRKQEVIEGLERLARVNKKDLPSGKLILSDEHKKLQLNTQQNDDITLELIDPKTEKDESFYPYSNKKSCVEKVKNFQIIQLFSTLNLTRITILSSITWFISSFCYYGNLFFFSFLF